MAQTEENKKEKKGGFAFIHEIAKYFMDFLETDFHKRKNPKRSVKLHNADNLTLGINLGRYPTFSKEIWKAINNGFSGQIIDSISKDEHSTKIPQNLLDVVKLQANKINGKNIKSSVSRICLVIENFATLNKSNFDEAFAQSTSAISKILKDEIINPLVANLKDPLLASKIGDESSLFMMEEELFESLYRQIETKLSELLKTLISDQKINCEKEFNIVLNEDIVKSTIIDFFESYKATDLYSEAYEIERNKNILDKQEFYLYFCDIGFNKAKYPIFYTPLTLQREGNKFVITFDSQVYLNKRALEFISQEYNNETGKRGKLAKVAERIIYLAKFSEGEFRQCINDIIDELVNYFDLSNGIDISDYSHQSARGAQVTVTNSTHLCLFDKSDEALVNDYEEILKLLEDPGNELGCAFTEIIDQFIEKEPVSFIQKIEDDWDETSVEDRLVYNSPIPLNSEQRQIISAIANDDQCKYIAVEGPPGTGKSHTITAIVFNAILKNQSVLVLSDKKEALDVVESKISDTMDKVRLDKKFQNPILRLGKTGNTYRQILSKSSIDNINTHYRAVKNDYSSLQNDIVATENRLKVNIKNEINAYGQISLGEVQEFCELDSYYEKHGSVIDKSEVLAIKDASVELDEFRKIFFSLRNKLCGELYSNKLLNLLGIKLGKFGNLDGFRNFLDLLAVLSKKITDTNSAFGKDINLLKKFKEFKDKDFGKLFKIIESYNGARHWIFGYLFNGTKVNEINKQFFKLFPNSGFLTPEHSTEELIRALEIFNYINEFKPEISKEIFKEHDYLKMFHILLTTDDILIFCNELLELDGDVDFLIKYFDKYPKTLERAQINLSNFETFCENELTKMLDDDFDKLIRYVDLSQKIKNDFSDIPSLRYLDDKTNIERLVTAQMTFEMDKRVIGFCQNFGATAKALSDIIKAKEKFPKKEFLRLKEAFPCILAGIRDYAEFIPLQIGLFDLVIIDEASQVSIAQAFPALLRAKKVIVFGDRLQFGNVKSYQAKLEVNSEYTNRLKKVFKENVSVDATKLKKLEYFNIKKSILDFFEFIKNYEIILKKHFRGYKENISYSNKEFYHDGLQVMKIRGKPVDEVLKFSIIKHDNKIELKGNTNTPEVEFIIEQLLKLKDDGVRQSVGIITPHTEQQKLCNEMIRSLPESDYFFDELKLKIMTFDTCQGEERDIIYFSMVATEENDKLWAIFPKVMSSSFRNEDLEDNLRKQRLNVGLSRSKECMHFVLSKPIEKYSGAIGEALRHYYSTLENAKTERSIAETDQSSKMEPEVLNWFYQTKFWKENGKSIELIPQFKIGDYLRQLDKTYNHPSYKVDFLLIFKDSLGNRHNIVIEYDGFQEHFTNPEQVDRLNYSSYYSEEDVYRQKVLESYGYKFLRINKFNVGNSPVATLDDRLSKMIEHRQSGNEFVSNIQQTVKSLSSGEMKECPKCNGIKKIKDFYDPRLTTKYGRLCNECKVIHPSEIDEAEQAAEPKIEPVTKTCPICANPMILRRGRYGKFYGCSKFPYCRGTRPV